MADENPTGGGAVVPLGLSPRHVPILRDRLTKWLDGVREDLKTPEQMHRPEVAREEARAYERLLFSLTTGLIYLPDEAALAAVEVATAGYDEGSGYAEIAANHDALHALLDVLESGSASHTPEGR